MQDKKNRFIPQAREHEGNGCNTCLTTKGTKKHEKNQSANCGGYSPRINSLTTVLSLCSLCPLW